MKMEQRDVTPKKENDTEKSNTRLKDLLVTLRKDQKISKWKVSLFFFFVIVLEKCIEEYVYLFWLF